MNVVMPSLSLLLNTVNRTSFKQRQTLFLPIMPVDIVAYAFTLLWDNLCRNSCIPNDTVLFLLGSQGGEARLNLGTHNLRLFFPPVAPVPNIPLRVRNLTIPSAASYGDVMQMYRHAISGSSRNLPPRLRDEP